MTQAEHKDYFAYHLYKKAVQITEQRSTLLENILKKKKKAKTHSKVTWKIFSLKNSLLYELISIFFFEWLDFQVLRLDAASNTVFS